MEIILVKIIGGTGTRPKPDFSRSGMYPTLLEPDLMKQNIKFGVKSANYSTKYVPDFLATQIRLFGIPTQPEFDFLLSDLFDTQLFATRSTTNSNIHKG